MQRDGVSKSLSFLFLIELVSDSPTFSWSLILWHHEIEIVVWYYITSYRYNI